MSASRLKLVNLYMRNYIQKDCRLVPVCRFYTIFANCERIPLFSGLKMSVDNNDMSHANLMLSKLILNISYKTCIKRETEMSGHQTPELIKKFLTRFFYIYIFCWWLILQISEYKNSIFMPKSGGFSKWLNNMATDKKVPRCEIRRRDTMSLKCLLNAHSDWSKKPKSCGFICSAHGDNCRFVWLIQSGERE